MKKKPTTALFTLLVALFASSAFAQNTENKLELDHLKKVFFGEVSDEERDYVLRGKDTAGNNCEIRVRQTADSFSIRIEDTSRSEGKRTVNFDVDESSEFSKDLSIQVRRKGQPKEITGSEIYYFPNPRGTYYWRANLKIQYARMKDEAKPRIFAAWGDETRSADGKTFNEGSRYSTNCMSIPPRSSR